MPQNRHLAAILFTDIVGSTALMQQDEQTAMSVHKRYLTVLKKYVSLHGGEILNDYGDGSLCCFSSASEAVRTAIEIQKQFQTEPKVPLRIGLHIGEIFFEDDKVFGDGVNVASRIQSLGVANSIVFSSEINSKIKNQPEFNTVAIGRFHFKNVDEPIEVYALSNEGLAVPQKRKIEGKLKTKKFPARSILVIGLIVLALPGFFVYRYFSGSQSNGIKSIAVLPFVNGSAEKENEFLGDGISQEIISKISRISSFDVKGWASSVFFKNSNKSLREKGEALGADQIVSGSIQKMGDRILIRVELTEANSGKRIWGNEYNRKWGDLLNIQAEVAEKIVYALDTKLTAGEKRSLSKHYTENEEAYQYYLKGRYLWSTFDSKKWDEAEVDYKKAVELDPDYALAYAGLSECYTLNIKGSRIEQITIAKFYAQKALMLDSTLSDAYATLGFIRQNFDYSWPEARKDLQRAIALDPNNDLAHTYYGLALMHSTPNKEGALEECKKAVDLNPLSYFVNWQLARNYYFTGKYNLALNQFKIAQNLATPTRKFAPIEYTGLIYLKQNLYTRAKTVFESLPRQNIYGYDNTEIMQSYCYAVIGEKDKAQALLDKTMKKYPDLSPYRNSQVYVALGNFDKAMDQLESGYLNRDVHMFWIKVDPAFDPIRSFPRFKALLKKMNLE